MSSTFLSTMDAGKVAVEGGTVQVFRDSIRDVVLALNVFKCKIASAQTVLHPQVCDMKVPDAPQPFTAAYAYGSCRVGT